MAQQPITASPLTITNQNAQTFTIPAAMALPTLRPVSFPDTIAETAAWTPYTSSTTYPVTATYRATGRSGYTKPMWDLENSASGGSYRGLESDWLILPTGSNGASFTLTATILAKDHSGTIYLEYVTMTSTGGTGTQRTSFTVSAQNFNTDPRQITVTSTVKTGYTAMKFRITNTVNGDTWSVGDISITTSAQPTTVTWAAGALTDGHMEGFWTTPNMLGDILDNPVTGGGLQPANPQYGLRPVNYVTYITASSRTQVFAEIKKLTAGLAVGKLKVSHHGEGYCWDGWLAAPPAVTWLSNDWPIARMDFTISFTDPYIWKVDWSSQKELSTYAYAGREGSGLIRDGAFWSSGSFDMSSLTSKSFYVRNPGEAESYPIIFVTFGPSTNTTYPRATYFTFYYSGFLSQWYWHFGPVDWDQDGGYTSWMIDTRTGQAYAGWSSEDGYKSVLLPNQVTQGDDMKLRANGGYGLLYIASESGVGEISVLVPQGRI